MFQFIQQKFNIEIVARKNINMCKIIKTFNTHN